MQTGIKILRWEAKKGTVVVVLQTGVWMMHFITSAITLSSPCRKVDLGENYIVHSPTAPWPIQSLVFNGRPSCCFSRLVETCKQGQTAPGRVNISKRCNTKTPTYIYVFVLYFVQVFLIYIWSTKIQNACITQFIAPTRLRSDPLSMSRVDTGQK